MSWKQQTVVCISRWKKGAPNGKTTDISNQQRGLCYWGERNSFLSFIHFVANWCNQFGGCIFAWYIFCILCYGLIEQMASLHCQLDCSPYTLIKCNAKKKMVCVWHAIVVACEFERIKQCNTGLLNSHWVRWMECNTVHNCYTVNYLPRTRFYNEHHFFLPLQHVIV